MRQGITRRALLAAGLALPFSGIAHAQLTCGQLTVSQTEGPFFKPKSPERHSLLETDSKGEKMVLIGVVLSRSCKPVAKALLDFWHADDMGEYDNDGFRCRGHQFSDAEGRATPAARGTSTSRCRRRGGASSPRRSTFPAMLPTAAIRCSART
jgi:protocatechuate 3,4-dioxygenase beta subunit